MTTTAHMARDLTDAIMHRIAGDGPAAAEALDRCVTSPRDALLTAYSLAHYLAEQVPGDGPVVVDTEDVAPGHEDAASLVGALVAAAGNNDVRGAALTFYGAAAKTAGAAIVDLLDACAAVSAAAQDDLP